MGKIEVNLRVLVALAERMRSTALEEGDRECAECLADVIRDLDSTLEAAIENR